MKKHLLVLLAVLAAVMLPATAAGAQDDVRVHLIHGIPDTDVDVAAGGEVVIPGFSYGDTQDLSGFAGTTLEGLQDALCVRETLDFSVTSAQIAPALVVSYGGLEEFWLCVR